MSVKQTVLSAKDREEDCVVTWRASYTSRPDQYFCFVYLFIYLLCVCVCVCVCACVCVCVLLLLLLLRVYFFRFFVCLFVFYAEVLFYI